MSDLPTIVVSTFHRGGSSMVMQMLRAGGVDCVGRAPDFEVKASIDVTPEAFAAWRGRAVKILEPKRNLSAVTPADAIGIWLDRDPSQRAKSALRLIPRAAIATSERVAIRKLRRSYVSERLSNLLALGHVCRRKTSFFEFEQLIEYPREAAGALAQFLAPHGYALDAEAMSRVIVRRSPNVTETPLEPYLVEIHR